MNGCGAIKESLCEWLDEELSAEQRLAVDAHLRQCAECRAELEALRAASNAVHALPAKKAPASIMKNLRAEIRAETSADAEGPVIRAGEAFARPKPEQYWTRGLVSLAAFLAVGVLVYVSVTPHVPEKEFASEQGSPETPKAKSASVPAVPQEDAQDGLKRIQPKQDVVGAPNAPPAQRKALAGKADDATKLSQIDKVLGADEKAPGLEQDSDNQALAAQHKAPEQAEPAKPEPSRDDANRAANLRKEHEEAAKQPLAEEKQFQKAMDLAEKPDAKPDATGKLAMPTAPPAAPGAVPAEARAKGEPAKEEAKRGIKAANAEPKKEAGVAPAGNGRNNVPSAPVPAAPPVAAPAPKPASTAPPSSGESRRDDEKKAFEQAGEAAANTAKFKDAEGQLKQENQDKVEELSLAQAAKRGEVSEGGKAVSEPEERKKMVAQAPEEAAKQEKAGQGNEGGPAFGGGMGGGRARSAPDKNQKDAPANAIEERERRVQEEADGKTALVVRLKPNQISDFTKNLEKKAKACGGAVKGAEELSKYRRTAEKLKAQTKQSDAADGDRNADEPKASKVMEQQAAQSGSAVGHRLVLRVPANRKDEVLALLNAYRKDDDNNLIDRQIAKEGKDAAAAQPFAGKKEDKRSVNDPAAGPNRPSASVAGTAEKEQADKKNAAAADAVPNDLTDKGDGGDAGMETIEIEVEIAP